MTTLLFIRHGQSQANLDGVFAGNYDAELTKLGYEQAERTAQFIAENYNVDAVYASDLVRAFETGKCIAAPFSLPVIPEPGMREIYAGKWEGVTFEDIVKNFPEEFSKWQEDVGNSRCSGGESTRELSERVLSAVTRIAEENDGKTVAVATHATPVRVLQCILSGASFDDMKDIPWVSNASVTEATYDNGEWKLIKIGEDSHMSDLKTTLPVNV